MFAVVKDKFSFAVVKDKLVSGYLITLKLGEAVKSVLPTTSNSNASTEPIDHHQQQQPEDHQVPQLQREPSKDEVAEDEPRPTKPERVISIKKLTQLFPEDGECSGPRRPICRIPRYFKDGEDNAWVPQIVSLGPYYHGEKHLRHMEQRKSRWLDLILSRNDHTRDLYRDSVRGVEQRARDCYEENITMSDKEFVDMMVLDGCFVIELLLGFIVGFEKLGHSREDSFSSSGGLMHKIRRDMMMLENQIPLFILDQFLGLWFDEPNQKGFAADLVLSFFNPLRPMDDPSIMVSKKIVDINPRFNEGGRHCLEVFWWSLLHSNRKSAEDQGESQRKQQFIHCVTELREAGIEFKKRKTDKFWDIQFENGVLHIPS